MDSTLYRLDIWIDQDVTALIPVLAQNPITVVIRGVEAGGVWLECAEITATFCLGPLAPADANDRAKVAAFIPFSQILYVATLDRKSFVPPARLLEFTKPAAANPGAEENHVQTER